jgi:hypothetical protein
MKKNNVSISMAGLSKSKIIFQIALALSILLYTHVIP